MSLSYGHLFKGITRTADARSHEPVGPVEADSGWRPSRVVVAITIAFVGTLLVAFVQGKKYFYWDSGEYWTLGHEFFNHGHFSLLNFQTSTRGYSLPLAYHGLKSVLVDLRWTQSSTVKLLNVVLFVLIGAVFAPKIAELAWPERRWGVLQRVASAGLLVVFWSGYLNFPLSDFPALTMALLAISATGKSESPSWMLLAGLACGLAINIRPAYVLLAPIVLVLVLMSWFDQRGRRHGSIMRRAMCVTLLLVGFALISLPQSLISHRYFGTYSFVPGTATHLGNTQLTEGFVHQRYDTYVGKGHGGSMFYNDEAGERFIVQQVRHPITGSREYLELIVRHPVTMGALFARHLINGLDARYSTPYVEHFDNGGNRVRRTFGFLLVFLALVRLLWAPARRRLGRVRWRYPLALALCSVTSVASHVEVRYLLPFYILAYILVLAGGWPNPVAQTDAGSLSRFKPLAALIVSYLVSMAVVWHVTSIASSQLHF